jgi:hypothetical protein
MAFGNATFTDFGGAVSDLFAASGDRAKAKGDFLEAQSYDEAAVLAGQNAQFTQVSTAVKQVQIDRANTQMIGGQKADVAGAGFSASGSALDLLRDSASQGALTKAVAGEQGLITEAGYKEQQQSYVNMSSAATIAGNAANKAAEGADIGAAFKAAAGIATLFTGGAAAPIAAVAGGALNAVGDPNGIGGLY